MGKGVLLDDVDIAGRDAAARVDVATEIGAGHRLKGLRLAQIGVAAGHNSAGVHISYQHTHASRDRGTKVSP